MAERTLLSILLYGEFDRFDCEQWMQWYQYTTDLLCRKGHEANYLGLTGELFKSTKILQRKRAEKRLLEAIRKGSDLDTVEIYSLPPDYSIAAFDYKMYAIRTFNSGEPYVMIAADVGALESEEIDEVVMSLSKCIEVSEGSVFEISNVESPVIFASKSNSLDSFHTLKIIKHLDTNSK